MRRCQEWALTTLLSRSRLETGNRGATDHGRAVAEAERKGHDKEREETMFPTTRWDPFWNFRHLLAYTDSAAPRATYRFPIDVRETEEGYVIEASLPGAKAGEVDAKVEEGVLTIRREAGKGEEAEDGKVLVRERRRGAFARALTLPDGVDAEKVEARLEDGVLTVSIPFAEERKPNVTEIPIQTG